MYNNKQNLGEIKQERADFSQSQTALPQCEPVFRAESYPILNGNY
jgi:hypothetical protein